MSKYTRPAALGLAAVSAAALSALPLLSASAQPARPTSAHTAKHVLLISVDGMHQSDLDWYVAHHPSSTLAKLTHQGVEFTNAATSNPSDSDPGGTALMTGGNPRSTGIYYDVEYSHKTDEPGAPCTPGQPATGGDVVYDSPDDALANVNDFIDPANGTFPSFDENGSIFANGVDTNPAAIMNLKNDASSFNVSTFPVDPATCKNVMPWDYLGDNTIFQVIHDAGMRTAWSDKHAVYMSFNGPGSNGHEHRRLLRSGDRLAGRRAERRPVPAGRRLGPHRGRHQAVRRLQGPGHPERDRRSRPLGHDPGRHPGDLRHELPGRLGRPEDPLDPDDADRSGRATATTPPAPRSRAATSGSTAGSFPARSSRAPSTTSTPSSAAWSPRSTRTASRARPRSSSPPSTASRRRTRSKLVTVQDGPIIDAINAAWQQTHPDNAQLIVAGTDDDLWQSYLSDNSQAACDFVKTYLWDHTAQGFDVNQNPVTVQHSGLAQIWAGAEAAGFFGVPVDNGHYPDVFGKVQEGIVYAKPTKLAEHGGMNTGDRHVLMVVSGPRHPDAGPMPPRSRPPRSRRRSSPSWGSTRTS